jgi:hypothetical protein
MKECCLVLPYSVETKKSILGMDTFSVCFVQAGLELAILLP